MSKDVKGRQILKLRNEGLSIREIAKRTGLPRSTVADRCKNFKKDITKGVIVNEETKKIIKHELNAFEQLNKINKHANEMLDLFMAWQKGDENALQILESQVRYVRIDGKKEPVKEFKFKDPRELTLRTMAEIRGQLSLQVKIFQSLFDLQAASEFQQEVLDAIGEVAPDVRDRIINNLQKTRAIRSAVDFAGPSDMGR